jgi:DNA-binding winged helix-turn-helix (wHTH) protein
MRAPVQSNPDGGIAFGPFVIDAAAGQLRRGAQPIRLRPRAWSVFQHLASRPGQLVSADELLDAVWGAPVTPQVLTNAVAELRTALDDSRSRPHWIETVYGRGYRFLGGTACTPAAEPLPPLIGRSAVLARLHDHLCAALAGTTQVVFVTGEPGIGKTAVARAFEEHVARPAGVRVLRGQCVERHGAGEPYLPFLQALEHAPFGPARAALRRVAPTWLLQLPALLRTGDEARLAASLRGAGPARMLREGMALLETLAAARPLLLVLEDLHWSDRASVDLLAALARIRPAAPLLLLGTFRAIDARRDRHAIAAVARSLVAGGVAVELPLAPFGVAEVREYAAARLGDAALAAQLAAQLEERSAGNPLFLGAILDQLVERGLPRQRDGDYRLAAPAGALPIELPASLREFVQDELEAQRPTVRRVLEAASLLGLEFEAAEIATAAETSAAAVEAACEALARVGRLIRHAAPNATPPRYAFVHASYRRIVAEAIAPERRRALHRKIAAGLETTHAAELAPLAARLAAHLHAGRHRSRAVDYLELAASNAEARFAPREAAAYLDAALAELARLRPAPELTRRAAAIELRLATLLVLSRGYSHPRVERSFARAARRFAAAGMPQERVRAEMGLIGYAITRGRFRAARSRVARLLQPAGGVPAGLRSAVRLWAGLTSSGLGALPRARRELEAALSEPAEPDSMAGYFDVHRTARSQLALILAVLGEWRRSAALAAQALAQAEGRRRGLPADLAHAAVLATERALLLDDRAAGAPLAARAAALAEEHGLPSYHALARIYQAYCGAGDPAARAAAMRDAQAARRRLHDRWHDPMLHTLRAETALAAGDLVQARAALARAAAGMRHGEQYYRAELARVRGALALATGDPGGAAAAARHFERALAIARRQGAVLWELRAALALARCGPLTPRRTARLRARLAEVLAPGSARRAPPEWHAADRLLAALGGPLPRPRPSRRRV